MTSALDRLRILSQDSQYDLACACGTTDAERRRRGADGRWLYPVPLASGGVGIMFKTLLSNCCANDCRYCPLRGNANARRCTLTPDEVVKLFLEQDRKRWLLGLFLSSGVIGTPDRTMDRLLAAAERLLGAPGKALVGIAVSCAVLSGIMGFYMASSRLMYSMAADGYLPAFFGAVDPRHGTPKNAMLFCMAISLAGPILGREALGWFVDMSAIGASIGYAFTCLATLITLRRTGETRPFVRVMAIIGAIFSFAFMVLQLVPIPGLSGVHFGRESYLLLVVWCVIGALFYLMRLKKR